MNDNQTAWIKRAAEDYAQILEMVTKIVPQTNLTSVGEKVVLSSTDYKDIATSIYIGFQKFGPTGLAEEPREKVDNPATDKQIGLIKYRASQTKTWGKVNEQLDKWGLDRKTMAGLKNSQVSILLKIIDEKP